MQASQTHTELASALDEQRDAAREQLRAAWQLHVERMEEQLSAGWKEHIDHVIEERFSELARRIEGEFEKALESRVAEARGLLRREVSEGLNQAGRRLRQCETDEELHATLLDAGASFCDRAAIFLVRGELLSLAGARGFLEETEAAGVQVPVLSAPAFANAVQSRDTVIAMRTAGELSDALIGLAGEAPEQRAYLFPIVSRSKAVAVLYVEAGDSEVDAAALELLACLAGSSLDERAFRMATPGEPLVKIAGLDHEPRAATAVSDWLGLPPEERELHLRAQRFARVQAAEMRLYKAQAVKAGRDNQNLYAELKSEIDTSRESFRVQFVSPCSSMIDYFHLELVRTLANDDVALLGPEYPGPLV